jgi:hypothetical protein
MVLNELMLWSKRTDILLSLIQSSSWTSAVDLHIPSSMRTSGIKLCARWVPKQLTDEHRQACVEMFMQFLQRYNEEGEAFLQQISTGSGTLVHHFEPPKKCQSME